MSEPRAQRRAARRRRVGVVLLLAGVGIAAWAFLSQDRREPPTHPIAIRPTVTGTEVPKRLAKSTPTAPVPGRRFGLRAPDPNRVLRVFQPLIGTVKERQPIAGNSNVSGSILTGERGMLSVIRATNWSVTVRLDVAEDARSLDRGLVEKLIRRVSPLSEPLEPREGVWEFRARLEGHPVFGLEWFATLDASGEVRSLWGQLAEPVSPTRTSTLSVAEASRVGPIAAGLAPSRPGKAEPAWVRVQLVSERQVLIPAWVLSNGTAVPAVPSRLVPFPNPR